MTSPSPAPARTGTYRRVPPVIDAWFDSGSMPFAQFGAPHRNDDRSAAAYPADFICEAIDQTRGWFYTLMAVGTLVFDAEQLPQRALPGPHPGRGRPQDEQAPRQHPGTDPADGRARRRRAALVHALRRFALVGPAGRAQGARRDRVEGAAHVLVDRLVPVAVRPGQRLVARTRPAPASARRPQLDRWALSRGAPARGRGRRGAGGLRHRPRRQGPGRPTSTTCRTGTCAARAAGSGTATRPPWHPARVPGRPHPAAGAVRAVRHRAGVAARCSPPTGRSSRCTSRSGRAPTRPWSTPSSVTRWPWSAGWSNWAAPPAPIPSVKTRQPLARALVSAPGWADAAASRCGAGAPRSSTWSSWPPWPRPRPTNSSTSSVKPNFRALGKRFGKRTQAVAGADRRRGAGRPSSRHSRPARRRSCVDGEQLADRRRRGRCHRDAALRLGRCERGRRDGRAGPRADPRAAAGRAGLRDIVRLVQEARKNAGLEVTDRIELWWQVGGSPRPAEAIRTHADQLAAEVLATAVHEGVAGRRASDVLRRQRRRARPTRLAAPSRRPERRPRVRLPAFVRAWGSHREQGMKPSSVAWSNGMASASWPLMMAQSPRW